MILKNRITKTIIWEKMFQEIYKNNSFNAFLQVDNEKSLLEHSNVLTNAKIQHKVWIEDGMAVCLAVKPMPKQRLKPFIGGLPLYK